MLKLIASGTTSLNGLDIDSEKKTRTGENIRRAVFFLLGSVLQFRLIIFRVRTPLKIHDSRDGGEGELNTTGPRVTCNVTLFLPLLGKAPSAWR